MVPQREIEVMQEILRKQGEVNVLRPAKPEPIYLGEHIWWTPSRSYMRRLFGKSSINVFGDPHD